MHPNQLRVDRMRRAMEAERLDALVLRLPENVLLLSGYWPMLGVTTLLFPLEGEPRLCIPEYYAPEATPTLWGGEVHWFRFGDLWSRDALEETKDFLAASGSGKGWKRIGYEA
ncbi:MAG: aminopeptidase family protein, partial [Bryobacterales bacterium]|nr:aminopeptidase family protein [Bryobacterales bacterium]